MYQIMEIRQPVNTSDLSALVAIPYYSGFELAHDTYNAISVASDGNIYYVLSSDSIDQGGKMYVYNPFTDQIKYLGDLTEICGEKPGKSIPQGKSHVEFYEYQGKLYFATHIGVYEMIGGIERLPENPPEGYSLYPGGHILSYDLQTGEFEDLATAPEGEGVVTMTMDTESAHIYAITWPSGNFIHYDLKRKELKNLGPVSGMGEAGMPGTTYRVLCRCLCIDPREGFVYSSTAEGDIFRYGPALRTLQKVDGLSLRLDYFGKYDFKQPGTMAYNWRKIIWHSSEGVAYGVHGNSGYLFRFDPKAASLDLVERISSEPSKRSGMFDQFTFGYLGLQLGPDGNILYYLTGAPIYNNGKRVQGEEGILVGVKGLENLHLVTYHIANKKYTDHGPVFYENGGRPTYANSIAIDGDGTVYTMARFEYLGKVKYDMIKIPRPVK
jgi:hypothetical protein